MNPSRRKQDGWREHCCPMCCRTTRWRSRVLSEQLAARSPTMPPTPFLQSSQTGGDRGRGRAPHRSACRVPLFGAAAQHRCAEPRNFATSQPSFAKRPGAWALHEGERLNRLEKVLYTAKAHTTGGARRHVAQRRRPPRGQAGRGPGSPGRRHQSGAALRGRLVRVLRVGDGVSRAQHEDHAAGLSRGSTPRSISVPKGAPSAWRLAST